MLCSLRICVLSRKLRKFLVSFFKFCLYFPISLRIGKEGNSCVVLSLLETDLTDIANIVFSSKYKKHISSLFFWSGIAFIFPIMINTEWFFSEIFYLFVLNHGLGFLVSFFVMLIYSLEFSSSEYHNSLNLLLCPLFCVFFHSLLISPVTKKLNIFFCFVQYLLFFTGEDCLHVSFM